MYYLSRQLSGLALAATLAACTGGGNADSTASGNQPANLNKTPAATRYDAFFDGSKLNVVDRSIDTPIAQAIASLSANNPEPRYWLYFDAKFTDEGFSDLAGKHLLYIDGGRFYRVDLINTTLPTPVALSSETQADRLCDAIQRQSIHATVAALGYRLPGHDGNCGTDDDVFRRVLLSHGAADAPQTISRQEFDAHDLFNRQDQISGSLSLADGGLQWRDANFANPQLLLPGQVFQKLALVHVSYDLSHALIGLQTLAEGGKPVWHLYSFDQQTRTISQELDNTGNGPGNEADYEYFGSYNGALYLTRNNQDIVALPENGGRPAVTVVTDGHGLGIAGNRLLLANVLAADEPMDIYSMSLQDSNPAIVPVKEQVFYYLMSESRLFYTRFSAGAGKIEATSGSIRFDGSDDRATADAIIAGAGSSPTRRWDSAGKPTQVFFNLNPVFSNNGNYSGGSLLGYNPVSGLQETSLGVVPAGVVNYSLSGIDYGGALPAIGLSQDGSSRQMYVVNWRTGKQTLVGSAKNPGDWWDNRKRSN